MPESKNGDAEAAGVARVVTDEITDGPICIKCIATARGLTRGRVEIAIASLRTTFLLDSVAPCHACGGPDTLFLPPLAPYDGRAR